MFRRVIDRTFNCVSVDTDTSTSDTAIVLASGGRRAGRHRRVRDARCTPSRSALTQMVARDGEGATKLIEVRVGGARDDAQAKRVAKAIVNSPLVKTAVHGADPNWGRVAMAIGKCSDDTDIVEDRVVIRFGAQEVFPGRVDADGLAALAAYMQRRHGRDRLLARHRPAAGRRCGAATSPTATCGSTPTTPPDSPPAATPLRGHADPAVDPDGLGVHVAVGHHSTTIDASSSGEPSRWGNSTPFCSWALNASEPSPGSVDRGVDQSRAPPC